MGGRTCSLDILGTTADLVERERDVFAHWAAPHAWRYWCADLGAATLDGKGGWSLSLTLGEGLHRFTAIATDLAGNSTEPVSAGSDVLVAPPPSSALALATISDHPWT